MSNQAKNTNVTFFICKVVLEGGMYTNEVQGRVCQFHTQDKDEMVRHLTENHFDVLLAQHTENKTIDLLKV